MINISSAGRLRPEDLCPPTSRPRAVIHGLERRCCNTPLPAKPSLRLGNVRPAAERVGPLAGSRFKAGLSLRQNFHVRREIWPPKGAGWGWSKPRTLTVALTPGAGLGLGTILVVF